jgi:hypothetical protein
LFFWLKLLCLVVPSGVFQGVFHISKDFSPWFRGWIGWVIHHGCFFFRRATRATVLWSFFLLSQSLWDFPAGNGSMWTPDFSEGSWSIDLNKMEISHELTNNKLSSDWVLSGECLKLKINSAISHSTAGFQKYNTIYSSEIRFNVPRFSFFCFSWSVLFGGHINLDLIVLPNPGIMVKKGNHPPSWP